MTRLHRITLMAAAGTVVTVSAVTGLVLLPAGSGRALPAVADAGRSAAAGDLGRASDQGAADQAVRAVHTLEARAQAAARRQQARAGQPRHETAPAAVTVTSSGSPQRIAQSMLAQFGWPASQFGCLDPLWERESGWNPYAANPTSGAYGIPQALPGGKMATAGPDWATSPATQIRWGLGYIKSTYGSPCAAWSHESAYGWY